MMSLKNNTKIIINNYNSIILVVLVQIFLEKWYILKMTKENKLNKSFIRKKKMEEHLINQVSNLTGEFHGELLLGISKCLHIEVNRSCICQKKSKNYRKIANLIFFINWKKIMIMIKFLIQPINEYKNEKYRNIVLN